MSAEQLAVDLSEYELKKKDLIALDRALRLDSNIPNGALSALEKEADSVIRDLRAEEAVSIWAAEHSSIPHPFPGMEFLTGRSIILQTKLFQIMKKMPKGALLHAHLDATVDASYLLSLALKEPAIYVRANQTLTSNTFHTVLPEFKALTAELRTNDSKSLTDALYVANSWVPIQTARDNFDPSLGGPEAFDKWVLGAMTINPSEAYGTHNTVTKIWQKFGSTFIVAGGIIHYMPIYTQYIREFILSSIEDGISYVEPRVNFWFKTYVSESGNDDVTHRDFLIAFERIVNEIKAEMAAQGRHDEFVGAKIIYTSLKFIEPEDLVWYLRDCIELKKEFPHLIAGFDLVGDENELYPLKHYLKQLLEFRHLQKEAGVDIPFVFHAGETLGDGTEADMNLYDAILLGTKRIGHGFSLVKHPELMKICRERNIALEVCPISNEILRLTSSMPMHPLPILINNGIGVALCSDDPAVFGNMGLSFDFFQVIAASEVTGIIQLGAMARDSISHSLLEPEQKELAIEKWTRRWEQFLQAVVNDSKK
uniref:adenosine deaminase n=1 Tax=Flammulina velutipes TaxID=38945 RepID=M5AA58_FLAVE|nr:adenosine deaminase-like growth factor [Flammulina velutipes]